MTVDIAALAKAEVHVHLEGCFSAAELALLAHGLGEPLPRPVERLFATESFDDFLQFLSWSCGLLRTRDMVASAAYAYAVRAAASGIVCADVIFNPTHWHTWHDDLAGLIDAMDEGFAAAEVDGLTPVGLCVSVLRLQTAAEAEDLVDLLVELRHPRVVALSIDGNEAMAGRTGPRFAEAFRRAGAAGLHRTVHAGESSGPEGVRDAIDLLGADRIDHGVRAIDDPALVAELAERRIPLGICPSSNLTLGIYPSLEVHPIDALLRAGVAVSINTDDPGFLGVDIVGEYERCITAFGWDDDTVAEIAKTSLDACFSLGRIA
ncbi:MAG: adenosine deaminase [Ilumatobacteraceae bacterium]|nr:adenosine deaminase [Ilumatobacteraceae bacterium]